MVGMLVALELGTLGLALADDILVDGDGPDESYGDAGGFDEEALCEAFFTHTSDPEQAHSYAAGRSRRDPEWVRESRRRRGAPSRPPEILEVDTALVYDRRPGSATLIDVRPVHDFRDGFITGAINIPIDDLQGFLDSGVPHFSYDKPIIVICEKGIRSLCGAQLLEEEGYDAISMSGGMHAWRGRGYPVHRAANT